MARKRFKRDSESELPIKKSKASAVKKHEAVRVLPVRSSKRSVLKPKTAGNANNPKVKLSHITSLANDDSEVDSGAETSFSSTIDSGQLEETNMKNSGSGLLPVTEKVI